MSLKPRNGGPSGWTSFLAHPFEVAVALLFGTSAYNLAQAEIGDEPGYTLLNLPTPIIWAWVACLGLGAVLVLSGLVRGPETLSGGTLERAGLYLAATAWVTLGISVASFYGWDHWEGYVQIFVVALGCALRLLASHKVEKAVHRAIKSGRGLGDES